MKVFVYGTLKRGYHNHRLLAGAKYLGEANLNGPHILLDAGFPVCVKLPTGAGLVTGELYEVTAEQLKRLDQLEGEGRMYHRRKRKFTTPEGKCRAWIYLGDKDYWRGCNIGTQWIDGSVITYQRRDWSDCVPGPTKKFAQR
jgi:gamma-glutamylaminecyclotransferase